MTDAHFYMAITAILAGILAVQTAEVVMTIRHILSLRKGKR